MKVLGIETSCDETGVAVFDLATAGGGRPGAEGLLAHAPEPQRTRAILDAWQEGCIELVIAAWSHLPEVWEQISTTWNETDADFPGVFEYEVISPFGEWLGDYVLAHDGQMPTIETVRQHLQELIRAFLPAQQAA